MPRRNLSLFEAERLTLADAIDLTIASLREYGARYRHWVITYSGGKDSGTVATLVCALIADGRVPAPASLGVTQPLLAGLIGGER